MSTNGNIIKRFEAMEKNLTGKFDAMEKNLADRFDTFGRDLLINALGKSRFESTEKR